MELFINETPFSKKELGIVSNYNLMKMTFPLMIIFAVLFAIIGGCFAILNDIWWGVYIWGFGFIFILIYPLFFKRTMKKNVEKVNIQNSKLQNVSRFYEDYVYVESVDNGEIVGTSKVAYKNLLKVTFLDEYMLLFVSKGSCYVLSKSNMTKGTAEDLIIFLYNKNIKFENLKQNAKQKIVKNIEAN